MYICNGIVAKFNCRHFELFSLSLFLNLILIFRFISVSNLMMRNSDIWYISTFQEIYNYASSCHGERYISFLLCHINKMKKYNWKLKLVYNVPPSCCKINHYWCLHQILNMYLLSFRLTFDKWASYICVIMIMHFILSKLRPQLKYTMSFIIE